VGRGTLLPPDPQVVAGGPDAAPARCTKPPSGRAPSPCRRPEAAMSDPDADPEEPEGTGERDWRRLLDGYAEPGRLRRLRDRQRRQQAARRGWLCRWLRLLLWRRSR
jgi:hypothetical protein